MEVLISSLLLAAIKNAMRRKIDLRQSSNGYTCYAFQSDMAKSVSGFRHIALG
jgi:hypothetical protein